MNQQCPKCRRVLEFPGEPAAFCPFCGSAMTDPGATIPDPEATQAPSSPRKVEVPERLGDYRLRRKLGQGGMGTVFEGEHEPTGRRVAVKLIDAEATPDALERFRQEGRLASALSHPRCVFVLAADEDQGRPYIVLELMPGKTLEDVVQQRGPLPVDEALRYTFDLLEGLEEVHQLGAVHRDVKPSNCFLDEEGRVKVGDFGLARSLQAPSKLTRTGAFVGTPLFAAPEQVKCEPLDARADVYAACATLYYLLTGKAPHDRGDGDYLAVMARVVSDDPPPLRSARPDLPRGLARIVARGLERDRSARWPSVAALREALTGFLPARVDWRLLVLRALANIADEALLVLLASLPALFSLRTSILFQAQTTPGEQGFDLFLGLLYYTLCDGFASGTPGKRLLGLRVVAADGLGRPGLRGGLIRTAVWMAAVSVPCAVFIYFIPFTSPGEYAWSDLGSLAVWALGAACLMLTARPRTGFRGLHELASATRVVPAAPRQPARRYETSPLSVQPTPTGWPELVGSFQVQGVVRADAQDRVLLALSPGLGRQVWLWLRPTQAPPVPARRRDLDRATRLRWLGSGEQDGWRWDAFFAPKGAPAGEVVRRNGPVEWEGARAMLVQLATELAEATREGTLPGEVGLGLVWLSPTGQVQLLDFPAVGGGPAAGAPIDLLGQFAHLLLEGKAPIRPGLLPMTPLPGFARPVLMALSSHGGEGARLDGVRDLLRTTEGRPARVSRGVRLAQLLLFGLVAGFPLFFAVLMGLGFGDPLPVRIDRAEALEQRLRGQGAALCAGGLVAPGVPAPARWGSAALLVGDVAALKRLQKARKEAQEKNFARLSCRTPLERWLREELPPSDPFEPPADSASRRTASGEAIVLTYLLRADRTSAWEIGMWVVFIQFVPVACVALATLFRGGVRHRLLGTEVVRRDGRPAGRLRCGWRALLVWLVPVALFAGARLLEDVYWGDWTPGTSLWTPAVLVPAMQILALGYLLAAVAVALSRPAVSLHDRLAGTRLVPR
jgi:hypothetical protein